MRELEFLPDWYPQTRRRKRLLVLQAWMSLLLAGGLGLFMFLSQRNVRAADSELALLRADLSQTSSELQKLDELVALQRQLRSQADIQAKIGQYVEPTRMINTLEAIMPPEMSLLDLQFEARSEVKPVTSLAKATVEEKDKPVDRRVNVTLLGVAPTDVDVANFLARLSNVPFFEQVNMNFARDLSQGGHLMREFEVTFSMNLNPTTPTKG